jgi:flavorubredoxin
MHARNIRSSIQSIATVHWERRLFDSLIPLPDGTSYNAYLVRGDKGTALIDTTDPALQSELLAALEGVPRIDYVVSQHSEQDHSGSIPEILARFPEAQLLCSTKAEDLLTTHLDIPRDRVHAMNDGDSVSLGNRTLVFVHTPWVHWPETMCTYVPEEKLLFSCDFFGSHLATTDLFVTDRARVYEAAKRYYAEIMMPFRKIIARNLEKLQGLDFSMIAPSHGPVYDDPGFILDAYRDWISPEMQNEVVLPYISMHGSTERMAKHLIDALARRGVGTPTVHVGPHPAVYYAAHLANLLRPKVQYAGIIGSYGWSSKAIEQISALIPNLKVEVLGTVLQKGLPTTETFAELDALAARVAEAHRGNPQVQTVEG